jgi:hypothetical protein|tara:strand:- start:337 stop:456 length:120 start_codon:yes stop_codon:yes gene_type:complete
MNEQMAERLANDEGYQRRQREKGAERKLSLERKNLEEKS